ncbi:hypothetical protein [Kitasatospora sp. NPDC004531]
MSVDADLYLRRTDGDRITADELLELLGALEPGVRGWRSLPPVDGVHYVLRLEDEPGDGEFGGETLFGFGRELPAESYDLWACLSVQGSLPGYFLSTEGALTAQCDRILAALTAGGRPLRALFTVHDFYRFDDTGSGAPTDLADVRLQPGNEGHPLTPDWLRNLLAATGLPAEAADRAQFADGTATLTLPFAELDRLTARIGTLMPPVQLLATHRGAVRNYWNGNDYWRAD